MVSTPLKFSQNTLALHWPEVLIVFYIIKEGHLYSWGKFHSTLENCEKRESLAQ